jgi:hypothetical protein
MDIGSRSENGDSICGGVSSCGNFEWDSVGVSEGVLRNLYSHFISCRTQIAHCGFCSSHYPSREPLTRKDASIMLPSRGVLYRISIHFEISCATFDSWVDPWIRLLGNLNNLTRRWLVL